MDDVSQKPELIVIAGPTAVGKTGLAIEMARRFNGEIISADSMQLFRRMDIGTAKPTPAEMARIPHHLVDIREPDQDFDAAAFAKTASETARTLIEKGKRPFVVGGTGLYIKALLRGIFQSEKSDPDVREHLRQLAERQGPEALHARLAQQDPAAAQRIHPHDRIRIIRALEVCESLGKPISEYHQEHRFARQRFHSLQIGLYLEREQLYQTINQRVDQMVSQGLLQEVQGLMAQGYSPRLKSMNAIGYRHMVAYLQGAIDWEEAVRTLKRDTRRYAKRQMTWFRADPAIHWYQPREVKAIAAAIERFLGENR